MYCILIIMFIETNFIVIFMQRCLLWSWVKISVFRSVKNRYVLFLSDYTMATTNTFCWGNELSLYMRFVFVWQYAKKSNIWWDKKARVKKQGSKTIKLMLFMFLFTDVLRAFQNKHSNKRRKASIDMKLLLLGIGYIKLCLPLVSNIYQILHYLVWVF